MSDTQDTTKAVSTALNASPDIVYLDNPRCGQGFELQPLPRYTVELTTEGWQIKDNRRGSFLADAFGSEEQALEGIEAAEERAADSCDLCRGSGVIEQEDELGNIVGYTACPEGCPENPFNPAHPDWKAL